VICIVFGLYFNILIESIFAIIFYSFVRLEKLVKCQTVYLRNDHSLRRQRTFLEINI